MRRIGLVCALAVAACGRSSSEAPPNALSGSWALRAPDYCLDGTLVLNASASTAAIERASGTFNCGSAVGDVEASYGTADKTVAMTFTLSPARAWSLEGDLNSDGNIYGLLHGERGTTSFAVTRR